MSDVAHPEIEFNSHQPEIPRDRRSSMFRTTLRVGLAGLVTALAVSLVAGPSAQAAPPVPPSPTRTAVASSNVDNTIHIRVNDGVMQTAKMSSAASYTARTNHTLHYAKVIKIFGKYTTRRREFTAGWYLEGGKVDQISGKELKLIKKMATHYRDTHKPMKSVTANADSGSAKQAPVKCKGRSGKTLHPGTPYYHHYALNSCQVIDIDHMFGVCTYTCGALTAVFALLGKGIAVAPAMMIFICGVSKELWEDTRDHSDLKAVEIWVGSPKWYAKKKYWDTKFVVLPQ